LTFLRVRHQLRISPFDLLRDPLLVAQLAACENTDPAWTSTEATKLTAFRRQFERPQRIYAWLAEARSTPPVDVFSSGDSFPASVEACLKVAERALATSQLAPVLISSWTGWAPSALERGERPEVPAIAGTYGRLVDWYRETFASAVRFGLTGADWFSTREAWHAQAFQEFRGDPKDYYQQIYAAEAALKLEAERRRLSVEGEFPNWYRSIFEAAGNLGLVHTSEAED
jgi:hypothetical protein